MKHLRFETFRLERMNSYIQLQHLFGRFGEVPGVYFSGLHTPQQGRGKIGMKRTLFAFPLADTYSRVWVFHGPKRWWIPHPLVSHPKTPQSQRLRCCELKYVEIDWWIWGDPQGFGSTSYHEKTGKSSVFIGIRRVDMPKRPSTCQKGCLRRHAKKIVSVDMPNKIVLVDMQKRLPPSTCKKMFPSTCQRRLSPLTCKNMLPSTCQTRLSPSTCKKDCSRRHAKKISVDMPKMIVSAGMPTEWSSICQNDGVCKQHVGWRTGCAAMAQSMWWQQNFDRVVPVDMPNKFVSVNMPKGCPSMCQNDGVRQHAKNLCPSACQNSVL